MYAHLRAAQGVYIKDEEARSPRSLCAFPAKDETIMIIDCNSGPIGHQCESETLLESHDRV